MKHGAPVLSILVALVIAAPQHALGQAATGGGRDAGTDAVAPTGSALPVQSQTSLKRQIGQAFTGAVVGGWLGFFASQVAVSDWQDRSDMTSYRRNWAAAGFALGAIAGRLTTPRARGGDVRPIVNTTRRSIERDAIVSSGATSALDIVRSLRKEWLIPRGVNSFRESARGTADFGNQLSVTPGADHILVYLDNARLGGTQHLEEIDLATIGRIEFIETAEAVFRWGTGHAHGVILLSTMPVEPR